MIIFNAVEELLKRIGPEVRDQWHGAWFLHVEGFHEARLSVKLVKAGVGYIEKLVKLVERLI